VSGEWVRLRSELLLMEDVITLDRPAVFSARKDRPILFSAFAWADILLTLDSADFGDLLGTPFYGMPVLRPGQFPTPRKSGRSFTRAALKLARQMFNWPAHRDQAADSVGLRLHPLFDNGSHPKPRDNPVAFLKANEFSSTGLTRPADIVL
jgi:hypothetical protein